MRVLILEDNRDRRVAMVSRILERFPFLRIEFFDSATAFIDRLAKGTREDIAAIALDHDLELLPDASGRFVDPGTGMDVANWLARLPAPICPVIVHSTNAPASVAMVECLTNKGWKVTRVIPHGDLEWVDEVWLFSMRNALVDEVAKRSKPESGLIEHVPEIGIGESALLTDIALCLNYYRLFSPGLYCCVHAPVELDDGVKLRPGVLLMVNHGQFKQCDPEPDYEVFRGGPNFVLDVFPADDTTEYERRRAAFERAKVIEYVAVWDGEPLSWTWNRLVDGKFAEIVTADDEMIMSTALPGLWIPASALKSRDWWTIMATIARGVTRAGHHEFMETIWKAGRKG